MNYEIIENNWISDDLWKCSLKVWDLGACICSAKIHEVEIRSCTRPKLKDIKKAALI